jgi:hypothetical protein
MLGIDSDGDCNVEKRESMYSQTVDIITASVKRGLIRGRKERLRWFGVLFACFMGDGFGILLVLHTRLSIMFAISSLAIQLQECEHDACRCVGLGWIWIGERRESRDKRKERRER